MGMKNPKNYSITKFRSFDNFLSEWLLPYLLWVGGVNTVREFVLSWTKDLTFGLALEKAQPNKCLRVYNDDLITKARETIAKTC
jgi:hypothetical protein